MTQRVSPRFAACLAISLAAPLSPAAAADAGPNDGLRQAVDGAIKPLMEQYDIPGLAVGVTIGGERRVFTYGLADKKAAKPVTRDTLFELGSVSKTFTATLATWAAEQGRLSLDDAVSRHVTELKDSRLDRVTLRHLATHTAGEFPLQVPDAIKDEAQLMAWFRDWKPRSEPGATRVYANPPIGLLGVAAARAMGGDFRSLLEGKLFPALGLRRTFVAVPAAEASTYAWGYKGDNPVRVSAGPLGDEAYGVKSNTVDMLRFLELNMGLGDAPAPLARALKATQVPAYRAGEITQDLVWEQYPFPVPLERIVAGNTPDLQRGLPAETIDPAKAAQGDVILNKTGSTNGFGAYVAFIPGRTIGIVILANRWYPNDARIRAAAAIIEAAAR